MSIMQPPTMPHTYASTLALRPSPGRSLIRVLVVDPHRPSGEALRRELDKHSDLDVVAHALTTHDALRLANLHNPDVVVTSLEAPKVDASALTRALVQSHPALGVILLTAPGLEHAGFAALAAGARGTVLKSAPASELVNTLRVVAKGEARLSADMTDRLLGEVRRLHDKPTQSGVTQPQEEPLTEREESILIHVVAGKCNKDIARHLTLSEGTVKNHVSRILAKLHARNRTELAVRRLSRP